MCCNCIFCCIVCILQKDGMNSDAAKKIQYRWENSSGSTATDYLDGRAVIWTVRAAIPGTYREFGSDGFFTDVYGSGSARFQYKVDGDKILYLAAGSSPATTPHYTDTAFYQVCRRSFTCFVSPKIFFLTGI